MNQDISGIHRTLNRIKFKEKKPANINKIITLVLFFSFLIFGSFFFLSKNQSITGRVIGKANECFLDNGVKLYGVNSLLCSFEHDNYNVNLSLMYKDVYKSSSMKISHIKINSCEYSPNTPFKSPHLYTFKIPCTDFSSNNILVITLLNEESGLEKTISGKIINLI